MTIGEKIRRVRTFRGMTQKELGITIGFDEKSADNRIAQYETDYRVPKKDLLNKIATVLDINPINFWTTRLGHAEEIMLTLFWLEESMKGSFDLFHLERDPGLNQPHEDIAHYRPSEEWPPLSHVGMYFKYKVVDDFLHEWLKRKEELESKDITEAEYFEWKLNWPDTCDDGGRVKPNKEWRKPAE